MLIIIEFYGGRELSRLEIEGHPLTSPQGHKIRAGRDYPSGPPYHDKVRTDFIVQRRRAGDAAVGGTGRWKRAAGRAPPDAE